MNFKPLLVLPLILGPATVLKASDYPPGYSVESSCQSQGPLEVCTNNHHYGNFPRITLHYRGYLTAPKKSAWIKFNGKEGAFAFQTQDTLSINNPVSYRCWAGGIPDFYQGPYGACLYHNPPAPEGLVWEINPIPADETDLLFYARNDNGMANAWDIEIAIFDEQSNWDSQFGNNYRFRFE